MRKMSTGDSAKLCEKNNVMCERKTMHNWSAAEIDALAALDLQRSPPEEEATPASVSDPVGDEPSAGEMRRARLRRFGLPSH